MSSVEILLLEICKPDTEFTAKVWYWGYIKINIKYVQIIVMTVTVIVALVYIWKVLFSQRAKADFASPSKNIWNAAHTYCSYTGFHRYPRIPITMAICVQMSIMDKLKWTLVFAFPLWYYHSVKQSCPSLTPVWSGILTCLPPKAISYFVTHFMPTGLP